MTVKNIEDEIAIAQAKYPDLCKSIIKDIICSALGKRLDGFIPASEVERQLGLSSGYFSRANNSNFEINAVIFKDENKLLVKLNKDIANMLSDGYICYKIEKCDIDNYEKVIPLTKNTLLGFHK